MGECHVTLSSSLSRWEFTTSDATSHSGGLIIGWHKNSLFRVNSWAQWSVLRVVLLSSKLDLELQVLNIYEPYSGNRKLFWEGTLEHSLFKSGFSLIGGDQNFTLGAYEIWGSAAQLDTIIVSHPSSRRCGSVVSPTPNSNAHLEKHVIR
jgi:hypothetical protein